MNVSGEKTEDKKITDEILAARDSGLSHISATLRTALADRNPVPPNLNARHPDWAEFAVRIGRALGREAEAITALKAAEEDKSTLLLENDWIAPALTTYLRQAGGFTGTAAELLPHLIEIDNGFENKLSAKGLGKRLVSLWGHLEKQFPCSKRTVHNGWVFTFQSAKEGEVRAKVQR